MDCQEIEFQKLKETRSWAKRIGQKKGSLLADIQDLWKPSAGHVGLWILVMENDIRGKMFKAVLRDQRTTVAPKSFVSDWLRINNSTYWKWNKISFSTQYSLFFFIFFTISIMQYNKIFCFHFSFVKFIKMCKCFERNSPILKRDVYFHVFLLLLLLFHIGVNIY